MIKNSFPIIICIVITINLSQSFFDILDQYSKIKKGILFFAGDKFSGLEKMLKNVKYVGYITDKSMDITDYAAQFAQAQYTLAPVILDLNNSGHEFILLDCTSDSAALQKLKEIKAAQIKKNRFGIILARRLFPSAL